MAVGDILKEQNLVVERFTVKSGEDIEKGEICIVNSGLVAAGSTDVGPFYMSMQEHDYVDGSSLIHTDGKVVKDHVIAAVKVGYVEAQATIASTIEKGDYLGVSSTAGELTLLAVTAGSNEAYIVGVAEAAGLTTDTTVKVTIGQAP